MWTPNIGSFTVKAIIRQKIVMPDTLESLNEEIFEIQFSLLQNLLLVVHNKIIKRGIEAVSV
jgi:hypothetical protein